MPYLKLLTGLPQGCVISLSRIADLRSTRVCFKLPTGTSANDYVAAVNKGLLFPEGALDYLGPGTHKLPKKILKKSLHVN
jgi:hypothetical protein